MKLQQSIIFALFCLTFVAVPVHAQSAPERLSWYSDDIKIDIYAHPDLCALPAYDAERSGAPQASNSGYLGRKGSWYIYRARSDAASMTANGKCLPIYSSQSDWQSSQLYVQGRGVVTQFKPDVAVDQWLAKRQLRGEPILSAGRFYLIEADGQKAIELANQMAKSGIVTFAQPNWYVETSKN